MCTLVYATPPDLRPLHPPFGTRLLTILITCQAFREDVRASTSGRRDLVRVVAVVQATQEGGVCEVVAEAGHVGDTQVPTVCVGALQNT